MAKFVSTQTCSTALLAQVALAWEKPWRHKIQSGALVRLRSPVPCSGSVHPERHLLQVKTFSLTEAIPRNNGTKTPCSHRALV